MRRLVFLVPLALFLGLAGWFAAALFSGRDPRELPSALIDKPAPDFDLPSLAEGRLSSQSLRGQVTVVNFFASWCAPCRVEHPILLRMARQEKIRVIGIAYKDRPEDSRRFLAELGDPFLTTGIDRDGRTGIDFGLYGVPETYVIDKQGRIRKRIVGPVTPALLDRELLPLLRALERS
ncbi:MAG: DsbE family thiol:disulfide interchange protein [Alphaproteobacteria bacterium]|nr:DsbE family thiol:disulfide interchange protein [Alphaproteobacteria bacterium]